MGVDGFRFDLATVLGPDRRRTSASRAARELLRDIADFAAARADRGHRRGVGSGRLSRRRLSRRAGPNGTAPIATRCARFLKGDGNAYAFADAVNGDYHRFADQGGPHKSVNFITAHDGFTLMDLVSYNERNNGIPWPFGPVRRRRRQQPVLGFGRRSRAAPAAAAQLPGRAVLLARHPDDPQRRRVRRARRTATTIPTRSTASAMWNNYDMIAHAVADGACRPAAPAPITTTTATTATRTAATACSVPPFPAAMRRRMRQPPRRSPSAISRWTRR